MADPAVIWMIAAATLVALLLRLFRLGHQSLWIDEVFTWYGTDIGRPLALGHVLENVHGPLFGLLLHAWGALAGDSEWALRFPSAVLGTATVPILAWLSGRWLGPATRVPAAWLAAGSPFLIWYSQEARNYALLFPCVCLGAIAMLALRERFSMARLAGFLTASAAGLLANLSYLLLAPLHLMWWLSPRDRRVRRLAGVGGVLIGLLALLSPWLPGLATAWDWRRLNPGIEYHARETAEGMRAFHPGVYPFTLHAFAVGYSFGPSIRELRTEPAAEALRAHALELAIVTLLFGTLAVLAWRAAARRRVLLAALVALFAPALFLSYGAIQNFKTFHPRYVSVSFPFLLALGAAAFADARPRLRAALAVGLVLVWGASLARHYFVPAYGKEDMRTAIARLRPQAGPGEMILAAGADDVVFYYYRGPLPVRRYWLGWAASPSRMQATLDAARTGTRGVWLVLSRGEDLDPAGNLPRYLDTRFPGTEEPRSEGVRVWHLPGLAAAPESGS